MLAAAIENIPVEPDGSAFADYLRSRLALREEECVLAIFLGRDGDMIWEEMIAEGCVGGVALPIRRLTHRALDLGAKKIILAHNHPSDNSDPSENDIKSTKQVVAVLGALGISLYDHLIVTNRMIYSMKTGKYL